MTGYPKLYPLGHRAVRDLLEDEVIVEEKIDGSQFSFGLGEDGRPWIASKRKVMPVDEPEHMFKKAAEVVQRLSDQGRLNSHYVYRGEYLQKPKHNSLAYDRTPRDHIMIFDVQMIGDMFESCLTSGVKRLIAERMGLESVPVLFKGRIACRDQLNQLLELESVLGGQKIEGVVIKQANVNKFDHAGKALMAKFVSERFKEIHQGKQRNPRSKPADVVQALIESVRTPARWEKAVQHLREDGKLTGTPKDIGLLIREVQSDVSTEAEEHIRDTLFNHFLKPVLRGSVTGLAEWYKARLVEAQFEEVA